MSTKAARFANYRGDQSESVGRVMGPNTLGEWLQCVTADYDPTTNRTRLGFAYNVRRNDDGSLSLLKPFPFTPST